MMENLIIPAEILTEIISRLPVESVLNCRLVCKTWQTLTYHPSFALMHLRHYSLMNHQHHLLDDDVKYQIHSSFAAAATSSFFKIGFVSLIELGFYGGPPLQLYYGEYDDDVNVKEEEEEKEKSIYKTLTKINHPSLAKRSTWVGSCNGLLCFTVYHHLIHDPVYICNPITKEYITLPKITKKGLKRGHTASGFGYYPKANEYKVVRIYYEDYREPFMGRIQVFTLGSGSGWRNKGEIKFTLVHGKAIFANGALHWEDEFGNLVSFDLADEEIFLPPSPPSCSNSSVCLPKVLGGFLCVATREEGECVKVWSLKKSNTEQESCQSWSWSLEFSIKLWEEILDKVNFFCVYEPFGLTKGGEVLLLWRTSNGVLFCYNLKTASIEKIVNYAPVALGRNCCLKAIPHMNSFISLKDLGEEDVKVIGSDEGVIIDQAPSGNLFLDYFKRADLDQDGLIRSDEKAIFFAGFVLPQRVLRQIFRAVDENQTFGLGEEEFYDALKLVSVVQSGKKLTPDVVNETLHGPNSANIPAPKIVNPAATAAAADKMRRMRCHKVRCGICRKSHLDKFNLLYFLVLLVLMVLSFFSSCWFVINMLC